MAGALERLVTLGHQFLVLLAAHLIHRLSQIAADVILVMHDVRVGHLFFNRPDKRLPHVHGHRFHRLLLLRAQGLPQLLSRLGRPIRHHLDDSRLLQIGQQSDVRLPTSKTLLVHPQVFHRFQLAPFQSSFHSSAHDLVGCLPAQAQ